MSPLHRFDAKLAALFLLLLVVLGGGLALLGGRAALRFADETEQRLNDGLAADLAAAFQPHLQDSIAHGAIGATIREVTGINPRLEIYLLGSGGMIKAAYGGQGQAVTLGQMVSTAPLQAYLAGAPLPILGLDPMRPGVRKPFTVAPLTIMGEAGCFLYVLLGSARYDTAAEALRGSYLLRTSLQGAGLALGLTALAGGLAFVLLTRRLRRMEAVVRAFAAGDLDRRVGDAGRDELGALGRAFDGMADTLRASVGALERADEERRTLVANVSHDLRSPLAAMQGYLETTLMRHDAIDPEERRRYLEVALRHTHRLHRLVEALFELSRLDAQGMQPRCEPFAMAELVQDVVMQHAAAAAARGVDLAADLPPDLPLVYADIGLVERAVTNLLDNALRYTPEGGRVRVAVRRERDGVRVGVADTGRGIPEADLPHVFERFYRVEKSRGADTGGTGLGLAIVQRIVALHGGVLTVDSTPGRGSTFSFTLRAWQAVRAAGAMPVAG